MFHVACVSVFIMSMIPVMISCCFSILPAADVPSRTVPFSLILLLLVASWYNCHGCLWHNCRGCLWHNCYGCLWHNCHGCLWHNCNGCLWFNCYGWDAAYNRFEAKIHDLRDQMMHTTSGKDLPSCLLSGAVSYKDAVAPVKRFPL